MTAPQNLSKMPRGLLDSATQKASARTVTYLESKDRKDKWSNGQCLESKAGTNGNDNTDFKNRSTWACQASMTGAR